MIQLSKEETLEIIKSSLEKDYRTPILDIWFSIDWAKMSHDRPQQLYYLNTDNSWLHIIKYRDKYCTKDLSVGQLKDYTRAAFKGCHNIIFEFKIKDDYKLQKTETESEWIELADFDLSIYFKNDKIIYDQYETTPITDKDILNVMIDLALKENDKKQFNKLVKQLNKLNENKKDANKYFDKLK